MDLTRRIATLTAWKGVPMVFVGTEVVAEQFSVQVNDLAMAFGELEAMLEEDLAIRTKLPHEEVRRIVLDVCRVVTNDLYRGGAPPGTELAMELFIIGPTEVAVGVMHTDVPESPDEFAEDGLAQHVGYDGGRYCLMHFADGMV